MAAAELEFLVQLLRLEGGPGEGRSTSGEQKIDWPALRGLALRQGVLPLAFRRLEPLARGLIPAAEWDSWKHLNRINSRRNLRLAQRLVKISSSLESRGIRALPFKGPVLAVQAYGDLSSRQITDLDFLIRGEGVEGVLSLLTDSGYQAPLTLTARKKKLLARQGLDFWLSDGAVQVDLHQQIPEGPPSFRLKETLWENLETVEILDRRISVLSPENTVLLLLIHGCEHGWDCLKVIFDLAYFIEAHPRIEWEQVRRQAEILDGRRMVPLGLILAQKLAGLNLPPALRKFAVEEGQGVHPASRLVDTFFDETVQTPEGSVFSQVLDSLPGRLRYLAYYALVPRFSDWIARPLPDFLSPLYYLIHPWRIFLKYGPHRIQSLFKKSHILRNRVAD